MVLLEECFSESGTRYGLHELMLGAANGSGTLALPNRRHWEAKIRVCGMAGTAKEGVSSRSSSCWS